MTDYRMYSITITGMQPLLMHADDVEWSDKMEEWKNDKDNKKHSRAGDDRSPAHRWIGNLYHVDGYVALPASNIMKALGESGSSVLVPGGRSGKTFKAQSQSGIMPRTIGWPIIVSEKTKAGEVTNKPILYGDIEPLLQERDFQKHKVAVAACGFSLFVKRAKIGQSRHVRVRPQFVNWSATGELVVTDDQITAGVLADLFAVAGTYKGIGDWRPSSPKAPGQYGTFTAKIVEAENKTQ